MSPLQLKGYSKGAFSFFKRVLLRVKDTRKLLMVYFYPAFVLSVSHHWFSADEGCSPIFLDVCDHVGQPVSNFGMAGDLVRRH
jgi:hypothetical protein